MWFSVSGCPFVPTVALVCDCLVSLTLNWLFASACLPAFVCLVLPPLPCMTTQMKELVSWIFFVFDLCFVFLILYSVFQHLNALSSVLTTLATGLPDHRGTKYQ